MIPLACRVDYWRNYVSYAPDIHIKMLPSTDPVFIDLKEYIIQGAKVINHTETLTYDLLDVNNPIITKATINTALSGLSPIPNILDKIPTERGWLLSYLQINLPNNGSTHPNQYGTGFYYQAGSGTDYTDCFNYALTNKTQRSNIGRVFIEVQSAFPTAVPLTLSYTVNPEGVSAMDSDLTTEYRGTTTSLSILPKTNNAAQSLNLMLWSLTYNYIEEDPSVKAQYIDVYRWDGVSWVLWESLETTAPVSGQTSEVLTLKNGLPLYNGLPQFKVDIHGAFGGGDLSIAELTPNVTYDPTLYKSAMEKLNAS